MELQNLIGTGIAFIGACLAVGLTCTGSGRSARNSVEGAASGVAGARAKFL